jgi:HPt (histidine-containing phosphotransfer) domain-containing protein
MLEDKARAEAVGMDAHLSKPVDRRELYRVLSRWLSAETKNRIHDKPIPEGVTQVLPAKLAGFDVKSGLRRCDGDEHFYVQQLRRFRDAIDEQYHQLPALITQEDLDQAGNLAHSLKGVAGAVAAVRLQDAATNLDQLLRRGAQVNASVIEQLQSALAEARDSLDMIDRSYRSPDSGSASVADGVGKEAVSALYHKLSRNEFAEERLLDEAIRYLRTTETADNCDRLRSLVGQFALDEAQSLLETIAAQHGWSLE